MFIVGALSGKSCLTIVANLRPLKQELLGFVFRVSRFVFSRSIGQISGPLKRGKPPTGRASTTLSSQIVRHLRPFEKLSSRRQLVEGLNLPSHDSSANLKAIENMSAFSCCLPLQCGLTIVGQFSGPLKHKLAGVVRSRHHLVSRFDRPNTSGH